jgi:hypothetical protein
MWLMEHNFCFVGIAGKYNPGTAGLTFVTSYET